MSQSPGSEFQDRARRIAADARSRPADQRSAFVDQQCGGDAALRRLVEEEIARLDQSKLMETLDPSTAGVMETLPLRSSTPAPKNIGPYKILEKLGEGGFGTVYLAEQTSPVRRRVALKIINPGMDSRAIVARFEQERQALAIMDHPNIAKVLDAGASDDGRPFFVMEYVAGEPITSYCDKNRLEVKDRLELFLSVCDAVQHAHHKGIIHRDIKPPNVLVSIASGSPQVKVIDFGVAKALSHTLTDKTIFTEHGQLLGTPEYMSPEQAEMGALDIDTRTDVYSLGVLLYELLTGALPFEPRDLRSKGYNEIQRIIREVDPPKPSTRLRSLDAKKSGDVANRRHTRIEDLDKQLRSELEWIPLKAMRKERGERYATPIAMAEDIRNHLAGRPLVAGPVSAMYRARKFVTRNRVPVAAAAAVLLAIMIGAIVSTIGFAKARQERDRATLEARRAEQEASRLRQVNLYITSMLASANPASGDRKNITVRELLDAAVEKLDSGSLMDQPRNEAALRAVIAATYRSLSLWDKAEPQWKKAQDLEASSMGPSSAEAAYALSGIGQVQLDTGRLDEAAKSLQDAAALQRNALAADDIHLGDTINNLGLLADMRGDLKGAESQYREALSIYQKNPKNVDRIADATSNLSTVSHKLGNRQEALRLATEALSLRRQSSGPRSVDVWNSLVNLASMQEAQDDLASAEQTRREALALAKELVDDKHRMVVVSTSALARTLWLRGGASLDEAEQVQTRGIELAVAVDGEQSQTVAAGTNTLACIMRDQGKNDRAVELFRKSLSIRRSILPPNHPDIAADMSLLADALTRGANDPNEAVQLASAALDIRKQVFPAGHWAIWSTTSVLGGAYTAAGQFDKAEPLLLDSYKALEAGSVLGKRPRVDAAGRLAMFYEKQGKMGEAGEWRARQSAVAAPATQP